MQTDRVSLPVAARVVIVQRQTLDWQNISLEEFREQSRSFCRLWNKPEDYVWRLRELWDATFAFSYLQTRAALKAQAEKQIRQAVDVHVVDYAGYKNFPDADVPFVFVDDDDWVSPTIAAELCVNLPAQYAAVLWRAVNIGSPQQGYPMFVWGLNGRCMTNNYALSGKWLRQTGRVGEFIQHFDALRAMENMTHIPQFDLTVTATNKSPCSSVSLDRGLDGDLRPARLVQMVEGFIGRMRSMTPELVWQAPWVLEPIVQTSELFEQIYASRY